MLHNIEFSDLPNGEVEVRPDMAIPYVLTPECRDFVKAFLARIREDYPEAYKALAKRYIKSVANAEYYEFRIARGFIKCNFARLDNKMDIDEQGAFNLEFIQCPLSGECPEWKIVCQPKFNTSISEAEKRVLVLIAQGRLTHEIADLLYLSPKTVENHTNNMLRKLGVHNNAALVNYYHTHISK